MNKDEFQRTSGATLVAKVMECLRTQIARRQLAPGARLPSIRGLAHSLQISASTVSDAYDRLVAEGVIRSRPGSGFYVTPRLPPFSIADAGPRLDREVDPVWMSRQSLEAREFFAKPGCGWLPSDWMPEAEIRRSIRQICKSNTADLVMYSEPMGYAPLRHLLARRLADRGIDADPQQIILTESGTQAVDLLCRLILEPGDTVLVDDPCYFNFHSMLRAHRAQVVAVPYTRTGPDLGRLKRVLVDAEPRVYITNSALHNPTGASLSPAIAHRVLKLAEQHDLIIIEDDIFGDFADETPTRLAEFDGLERVIHVSSFSKSLSASIRCGIIALREDWVDRLIDLKLATSFAGGGFGAHVVERLLTEGSYRKHMGNLRTRLTDLRGSVGEQLTSIGVIPWIEPAGGMFLWCALPDGVNAANMARHALAHDVVLAPGNAFSPTKSTSEFMRFNVAQMSGTNLFCKLDAAMTKSGTSIRKSDFH